MERENKVNLNSKKVDDADLEQVINSISSISRKQKTLLVGIDGCGGSGKSTLADKMKMDCTDVTIVHMDDFYLPSPQHIKGPPEEKPIGADFDWERMLKDVIEPLRQNKEGCYQRYDWEKDNLSEWHTVPIGGIVVIEGVYSLRNELVDKYDHTIWVDCPRDVRLSRGLARDGENARDMWINNWMVSEDLYVEAHKPLDRVDLVVTGTN